MTEKQAYYQIYGIRLFDVPHYVKSVCRKPGGNIFVFWTDGSTSSLYPFGELNGKINYLIGE